MSDAHLEGTELRAQDRLSSLRATLHTSQFSELDTLRQFINEFISANPSEVTFASIGHVAEIAANVRASLGLGRFDHAGISSTINDHVQALILGRAHAGNDSARWAVQQAASDVSMASGQLIHEAHDIFIDGAGMDLRLRRIYKNQGFSNGAFGTNWDHNYNLGLREEETGAHRQLVRLDGAGQESVYSWHLIHGYWVPPPGDHSVIVDLAQPAAAGVLGRTLPAAATQCTYALRNPLGEFHFYRRDPSFPNHHVIRCIIDRFDNQFVFDVSSGRHGQQRLGRIHINSAHRWIRFKYDDYDRVNNIVDHTGRTWRYTYDSYADLQSATIPATKENPGGHTTRYRYSTPTHSGELQHNLIQVFDTAGNLALENEYGKSPGLLTYNRVIRQSEGNGERTFEYQDVQLGSSTSTTAGALDKDTQPAHQTTMTRRNGHAVHFIHNHVGNLLAREEDVLERGRRQRLVTHYRYNRDGAVVGQQSAEGRRVQTLYGRDYFLQRHALDGISESDLCQHAALRWQERMAFANRLAVVRHGKQQQRFYHFQFPSPMAGIRSLDADHDIAVKYTYDPRFQFVTSVSHPRYTTTALPGGSDEQSAAYRSALLTFTYDTINGTHLEQVDYPNCSRQQQTELSGIKESYPDYDSNGRPKSIIDRAGTLHTFDYHPPGNAREGYLKSRIDDPQAAANPTGLNLETLEEVNPVGEVTAIQTPNAMRVEIDVDALNRISQVTRTLKSRTVPDPVSGQSVTKPELRYDTRYRYGSNLQLAQIERDLQDDEGQVLGAGVEVQQIDYDSNGNVIRQSTGGQDPGTHLVTRFRHDDGDSRTHVILPRGNQIRIKYDARRLPRKIIRGSGSPQAMIDSLHHDGDGLLTEHVDGRGQKTCFSYDGLGQLFSTSHYGFNQALQRLIRHDYDKSGNLVNERLFSPRGVSDWWLQQHVSYEYNELDQLIERRLRILASPLARTQSSVDTRDDLAPLLGSIRSLYYYDTAGRLTRVEQRGRRLDDAGAPEPNQSILSSHYHYNSVGWLVTEIDAIGNRIDTQYDANGLVKRVDLTEMNTDSATGMDIFSTQYNYDSLGRLVKVIDPLGNQSHLEYDSRDAEIRRIDVLGNVSHQQYDVYGRLEEERIEMPATGLGDGPRSAATDIVTQFEFDANGNRHKITDAAGATTIQRFDALDRRSELIFPDGNAFQYTYDAAGNITSMTDPNGLVRNTTYDIFNNPLDIRINRSSAAPHAGIEGADHESFQYDANGYLVYAHSEESSSQWWCNLTFERDSLGRSIEEKLTTSISADTLKLQRDYDEFGFLRRLQYPDGRKLLYRPDDLLRVVHIESLDGGTSYPGDPASAAMKTIADYQYAGQRLTKRRLGNGTETHYAHDAGARLIEIAHLSASHSTLLRLQQLFDGNGNMRLRNEYELTGNTGAMYAYNARQQLTTQQSATAPPPFNNAQFAPLQHRPPDPHSPVGQSDIDTRLGNLAQQTTTLTWQYDKLGNRVKETPPGGGTATLYGVNALNQYTHHGTNSFHYDANGNLLSERQSGNLLRKHTYNYRNQLVKSDNGNATLTLRYDALGRCVVRETPSQSTFYIHDDVNVIQERRVVSAGQPTRRYAEYVNDREPDSRIQLAVDGQDFWYHTDTIGSTLLLTNNQGNIATDASGSAARYRYSPFGIAKSYVDIPNPYLFGGRRYDATAAAYDFRNRHYRPEHAAFMQRDPEDYDESANLYTYARNNPLTTTDRFGLSTESEVTKTFTNALDNRGIRYSQEVPIKVKAGSKWISGRADLIYKDPATGRFKVIEFKGESLTPSHFTPGQRHYIPALAKGAQWEVIGQPWIKSKGTSAVDVGLHVGFRQQGGLFKLKAKATGLIAVFHDNVFNAIGLVPAREIQLRGNTYKSIAPGVFKRIGGAAKAAGANVKGVVPMAIGLLTDNIMQEKAEEDFLRRYQYTRATLSQLDAEYEASIGFHFAGWQKDPINPQREVAKWQFKPTGTHRLVMGTYYLMNMFMAHHPVLYMMQHFPGYYSGKSHWFKDRYG